MRLTILSLAAASLAAPAFAGNVEPAPIEPIVFVDPAPLVDWSGGYAGLVLGGGSSDVSLNGDQVDDNDEIGGGVFLGSNFQSGNIVYGGELSLGAGEDTDYAVGLRGRVGYAAGRALPYLAVGYAFSDTGDVELDGPTVGLGVDYMLTDRVFLGAEVSYSDLEGDNAQGDIDIESTGVGVRLGFRF